MRHSAVGSSFSWLFWISLWTSVTSFPRLASHRSSKTRLSNDILSFMWSPRRGNAGSKISHALRNVNIPKWDQIQETLVSLQTPEEQSFRDDVMAGRVASPMNQVRRFAEGESPRVTFYRDSASWCPYCQKVWITLEEKQIAYKVEKVSMSCYGDKPMSFLMMQPSGQIPVAQIDGKTYRQSNDILYALEEIFPEKPVMVPQERYGEIQELLRLERKVFGVWLSWLTGRDSTGQWKQEFERTLTHVEQALSRNGGPFFLGKDISTVDIQFAPFLERMAASLLYFKGFPIRVTKGQSTAYPHINRWFDHMEKRTSYQLTKSDIYTHAWDLPPQLGGCTSESGSDAIQAAINGQDDCSWKLPLIPHNGGLEPDWEWCGDEKTARREVVERLTANAEAIVRFACRGAGTRGVPRVSAPLADPNASPNENVAPAVDAILRITSLALLEGKVESYQGMLEQVVHVISVEGADGFVDAVCDSLVYLRDRVGVPRDMRLPAARQLRAHLNWAIDQLSQPP